MSDWSRRQSAIRKPKTLITEEAVSTASRTFRASVQRLDPRIQEEPVRAQPMEARAS